MIAALNDSGFLVYLQPISKDNPNATVKITSQAGRERGAGVRGVGSIVTATCGIARERAQQSALISAPAREQEKTKK